MVIRRKTKGLIAVTVSLVNGCEYGSLAHDAMVQLVGAISQEIVEAKEVVKPFWPPRTLSWRKERKRLGLRSSVSTNGDPLPARSAPDPFLLITLSHRKYFLS
jgi:AhpD family alkylhydroperoxidase